MTTPQNLKLTLSKGASIGAKGSDESADIEYQCGVEEKKPLEKDARIELLDSIIPEIVGMSMRKPDAPLRLPSGELCSEIVVARCANAKVPSLSKGIISLYFGTGPTTAEQCCYEFHYHLAPSGDVMRLNLPKVFKRGGALVKRSSLYTPETSVHDMFESLLAQGDRLLAFAAQLPSSDVPENHTLQREFSVEFRQRG